MKYRNSKIVLASLLLLSFQALASEKDWYFKPYVGADVGAQSMDWETGFGDFHFKDSYGSGNLNLGVLLHPYFAIEMGYEHMRAQTRTSYYNQGVATPVLGFTSFGGAGPQNYVSDAEVGGFNLSAVFTYPVAESTNLFVTLGANWAELNVSTTLFDQTLLNTRPVYWHSDRHAIGRFGAGIRHNILPNFGARLYYLWEKTSKLNAAVYPGADIAAVAAPTSTTHLYSVKPKNSHLIMAGLFLQMP